MGLIVYLHFKKNELHGFISTLKNRLLLHYKALSVFDKWLLGSITLLLALVFAQGIIYPPNNRDSLTYHLGRIVSWVSHHSVAPYPTHIVRQLYLSPFSEYVILHVNLLAGSDLFSASVQFFFLLFCAVAIISIIKCFGLGRIFQVMALVLSVTIPEVVLEASSTQNDIVVAFFILSAFYFCLKWIKEPLVNNYLFLGLSTGLAILTKGTAYMYLAPILLLFGICVLIRVINHKEYKQLLYSVLFVALVPIIINAMQYYRNYSYSGNLLGVNKNEAKLYGNERMTVPLFVGNAVKDADLQVGLLWVPQIIHVANKCVHKLFDKINVNLNDTAITFPTMSGIPGDPRYHMQGKMLLTFEDTAPNFIHFLLILFALAALFLDMLRRKTSRIVVLTAAILILQIIIFCGYLKWQPLGTRLQTTLFLFGVPLICYACYQHKILRKIVFYGAVPFCVFYAFLMVLFNCTRPYISCPNMPNEYFLTQNTSIYLSRYEKRFSAIVVPATYGEYKSVNDDIRASNFKNIGLIIGYNDWEYPLFADCYRREINPVHLLVNNYTKNIKDVYTDVDCIVSTTINKPFIDYEGRRFYNRDAKNTVLFYYKP